MPPNRPPRKHSTSRRAVAAEVTASGTHEKEGRAKRAKSAQATLRPAKASARSLAITVVADEDHVADILSYAQLVTSMLARRAANGSPETPKENESGGQKRPRRAA
jgi:hypothetical protein